jgi:DNA-binding FrmR family transcriptional regulator
MTEDQKKLIHHISRLEGQLASVKRELANSTPDCTRASQTLCAASRSFASFRRLFVERFLETHYLKDGLKKNQKEEYAALLRIINS